MSVPKCSPAVAVAVASKPTRAGAPSVTVKRSAVTTPSAAQSATSCSAFPTSVLAISASTSAAAAVFSSRTACGDNNIAAAWSRAALTAAPKSVGTCVACADLLGLLPSSCPYFVPALFRSASKNTKATEYSPAAPSFNTARKVFFDFCVFEDVSFKAGLNLFVLAIADATYATPAHTKSLAALAFRVSTRSAAFFDAKVSVNTRSRCMRRHSSAADCSVFLSRSVTGSSKPFLRFLADAKDASSSASMVCLFRTSAARALASAGTTAHRMMDAEALAMTDALACGDGRSSSRANEVASAPAPPACALRRSLDFVSPTSLPKNRCMRSGNALSGKAQSATTTKQPSSPDPASLSPTVCSKISHNWDGAIPKESVSISVSTPCTSP
mmetsp:Transcript_494/g.1670  ORF Transcript_494/g.1670 Transcript_494/m.1670 type:complete len:385 (-) Transcript_494:3376-4530(-)